MATLSVGGGMVERGGGRECMWHMANDGTAVAGRKLERRARQNDCQQLGRDSPNSYQDFISISLLVSTTHLFRLWLVIPDK
jgi:hypothetical protein